MRYEKSLCLLRSINSKCAVSIMCRTYGIGADTAQLQRGPYIQLVQHIWLMQQLLRVMALSLIDSIYEGNSNPYTINYMQWTCAPYTVSIYNYAENNGPSAGMWLPICWWLPCSIVAASSAIWRLRGEQA